MRMKAVFVLLLIVALILGCNNNAGNSQNRLAYIGMSFSEFKNTKAFKKARYLNSIIAEPELANYAPDNESVEYNSMYFDDKDLFGNDASVDVSFQEDTRVADPIKNEIVSSIITVYSKDNALLENIKEKHVKLFLERYNGIIKKEFGRDIVIFYIDDKKMESKIDIKDGVSVRISIGHRQ